MTDLILKLASVMQNDINRLTPIAQNIANSNTVGYKAIGTFAELVADEKSQNSSQLTNNEFVNTKEGAIKSTGRLEDLAISGDGWFLVRSSDILRLTRNGQFFRNANGVLVNSEGWRLQGQQGDISVPASFIVDANGLVKEHDNIIAEIKIVTIEDKHLKSVGNNLYAYSGDLKDTKQATVYQRSLESSNVDMNDNMVNLIQISRHIETMQRAISAYDSVLSTGINQLGKE